MSQELKAIEILKDFVNNPSNYGMFQNMSDEEITNYFNEAIKELEEYEQNFKQKEFDYRTKCQSILSSENLAKDEKDSCNNCKFKDIYECVECLTCRRFWSDNFELMKWQSSPQNEVMDMNNDLSNSSN
jgi:hypothetical protein